MSSPLRLALLGLLLVQCTGKPPGHTGETAGETGTDSHSAETDSADTAHSGDSDSAETDSAHTGDPHTGETDTGPLPLGAECDPEADTCVEGALCCAPCCATGAVAVCSAVGEAGRCPLPDLSIDEDRALEHLRLDTMTVAEDACAVEEACVDAPGERRLLRFTTTTPNLGEMALELGDPSSDPERFEYSTCHAHYHFRGYMEVSLEGEHGVVLSTQKQAFCLMDSEPWGAPPEGPRYHCGFQGISLFWADTYAADLDCQWLDVTDVPPGTYTMRMVVDPEDQFPEVDELDNELSFPVEIPAPS